MTVSYIQRDKSVQQGKKLEKWSQYSTNDSMSITELCYNSRELNLDFDIEGWQVEASDFKKIFKFCDLD